MQPSLAFAWNIEVSVYYSFILQNIREEETWEANVYLIRGVHLIIWACFHRFHYIIMYIVWTTQVII